MRARVLLSLILLAGAARADPPAQRPPRPAVEHPKRPAKPVVPRLSTKAPTVKAPPAVKAPTPAPVTPPAPKKPPVVMKPPAPKPEPAEPRPEPRRRRSPTGEDEARDPMLKR
jgi:hypothetical protein